MERTLFQFILKHSGRQQLMLVLLTLAGFPFLYLSLELPKKIVNDALAEGGVFPVTIPWLGIELEQIPYLLTLSFLFLLLVFVNGGFKYAVNVYSGVVGERMLRRLRYTLFSHTLRFPLRQFRKTSQGELVAAMVAETEPLAGFVGESVKLPVFQGGTLLTILVFMFMQDWVLGLAAISLYPVQAIIIPRLQRRLNELRREMVLGRRRLSDRISEVVSTIPEIHAHDTSRYERAMFSDSLAGLYRIRLAIFRRKFMIKFLNNFLAQVTPFFFYSIGGVLVIRGELTFGALVAVLAAYKDLNAPWRELLSYYEQQQDAKVKYDLLRESFALPDLLDERLLDGELEHPIGLAGSLVVSRVPVTEAPGDGPPASVSFRVDLPARVGVVGEPGSGADTLAQLLARLELPRAGSITVAGLDMASLPERFTGRRIGYVAREPRLRSGRVRDLLLYPLKRDPLRVPSEPPPSRKAWQWAEREARLSGNAFYDPRADWTDYEALGVSGPEELLGPMLDALRRADLAEDVYGFGLYAVIDPEARADVAEQVLRARQALRRRLGESELAGLIEPFEHDRFMSNLTVAENLLFGAPRDPAFALDRLAESPVVLEVLSETGLDREFVRIGVELAELMVELFADVDPSSDLFERFSFISADALPAFRSLLARIDRERLDALDESDRKQLLALPFKLAPARHRLGLIDDSIQERLLRARQLLRERLGEDGPVEFFDERRYNRHLTLLDNILFGRIDYARATAAPRVRELVREIIEEVGLLETVLELGLDHDAGLAGSRLTMQQRQKLSIARNLLKQPDLLIVDDALSSLEAVAAERVARTLASPDPARSLIWVMQDARVPEDFERCLVIEDGRVVADGPPREVLGGRSLAA